MFERNAYENFFPYSTSFFRSNSNSSKTFETKVNDAISIDKKQMNKPITNDCFAEPIPVYQSNQFHKQSNTYNQNNTITTYHQWCLILLEYDSSIKHSKSTLLKIKTNARL